MKTTKRSKRRLPSPVKISLYLLVVASCCIVNWSLLKAGNIFQQDKSFELIIVEEMLDKMDPVNIPGIQFPASEAMDHRLELQGWMLNIEAYKPVSAVNEPELEDWMINTSSWKAVK